MRPEATVAIDEEVLDTDDLLNELARRFPAGLFIIERNADQVGTRKARHMRAWGNSTWGIGAAAILTRFAHEQHDDTWNEES